MAQVSFALVQKIMSQGLEKAVADYGRPIALAVCDANGNLLAFSKMDGTVLRSGSLAVGKAYTASRMEMHTEAFQAMLQQKKLTAVDFCDLKLTSLLGGAVIKDQAGNCLGAVGISGLKPEEDQRLAISLAAWCEQELR